MYSFLKAFSVLMKLLSLPQFYVPNDMFWLVALIKLPYTWLALKEILCTLPLSVFS